MVGPDFGRHDLIRNPIESKERIIVGTRTVVGAGIGTAIMLAGLGVSAQAAPPAAVQVAAPVWPISRCSSATTRGGGYLETYWNQASPGVIQVRSAPAIKIGSKTYKRTSLNRTTGRRSTVFVLGGLDYLFGKKGGDFTYLPAKLNMQGTRTVITVQYDSGHNVKCLVDNYHPKPAGRR